VHSAKPHYDVVLLQPNVTWVYDPFEHLGLSYVAAALRKEGFRVKILDAVLLRWNLRQVYSNLDELGIGALGVTLISHGYPQAVQFLEYYRRRHPETRIVAGGHFATFARHKIFENTRVFDAIVLGEGERSFSAYCRATLRGEECELPDIAFPGQGEPPRSGSRIRQMDELAFPSRDCLPLALSQGGTPTITSSRGCYARCSFCTVHKFYTQQQGPRWVPRSIESVLEELRSLYRDFHIRHFMFVDDNFIGSGKSGRRRALQFAEAYRASALPMTFHIDCRATDLSEKVLRELVQAGLRSVFLGVESVCPNDLVLYRKDVRAEDNWRAVEMLKKYGVAYTLAMIMFNPLTTEQALLENCRFLRQAEFYPRNPISILNVYEGTELAKTLESRISGDFWNYRFEFAADSVRRIYSESMRFCKDTLPLERELSRREGGSQACRALYRVRLLFLEDLARHIGSEPAEAIRSRWWPEVAALCKQPSGPVPRDQ
jgi:anaerobic magnesium-protoporphyrin IX monomethyl ester cyclase